MYRLGVQENRKVLLLTFTILVVLKRSFTHESEIQTERGVNLPIQIYSHSLLGVHLHDFTHTFSELMKFGSFLVDQSFGKQTHSFVTSLSNQCPLVLVELGRFGHRQFFEECVDFALLEVYFVVVAVKVACIELSSRQPTDFLELGLGLVWMHRFLPAFVNQ